MTTDASNPSPPYRQAPNRRRAAILARVEQRRRRSVAIEAAKSLLFGFVVPVIGAAAGLCWCAAVLGWRP